VDILALQGTIADRETAVTVHDVGRVFAEFRRRLEDALRADPASRERAIETLVGPLPTGLEVVRGVQPLPFCELDLLDTAVEFDGKWMAGPMSILQVLAQARDLTLDQVPDLAHGSSAPDFSTPDGQWCGWAGPTGVGVFHRVRTGSRAARKSDAGTDNWVWNAALVLAQRTYLRRMDREATDALHALPRPSASRKVTELHAEMADFTSRWRYIEPDISWRQAIFDRLEAGYQVQSLADGVNERIAQAHQRIEAQADRFQNLLLTLLTVLLLPLNMAAAMFSGVQMQKGENQWLPFVDSNALSGWAVFGVWLLCFTLLGGAIVLAVRWKVVRKNHLAEDSTRPAP